MKKYTYSDIRLSISYPDNWDIEGDKDLISIYDPIDGVGVLQFSFYRIPNPQNIVLRDELEEYLNGRHNDFNIIVNKRYVYSGYTDEKQKKYWRYWLFLRDSYLIFVSYNCQLDDTGKEDKIIDDIISSGLTE